MPAKLSLPKGTVIPDHIAVILDGNGRWARAHGLPTAKGHEAGAKSVRRVIDACRDLGVHTLTIWGFSTENWKRPPQEVAKIMQIVKKTIESELDIAKRDGVKIIHIGRRDRMPKPVMKWIEKAERETADNKKYILNLALDYGGRDEILRAVKKIVDAGIKSKDIDEKLFESYLDTANQPYPNPDLFIRTSGELRTSGYLPWQMVYTEFYFEEGHLPDMTPEKLKTAVLDFSRRRRRFGGKDKMTHFKFKPEVAANLELNWWRLSKIPEGTKFRDYAIEHIVEQWGLSKKLAGEAAVFFTQALVEGNGRKWQKATKSLTEFYKLVKEEVSLAFEPDIVASIDVKLLQKLNCSDSENIAEDVETVNKKYVSEVYRLSDFQAKKAAHLRTLATIERRAAMQNGREEHWQNAERYLEEYYIALKDRVA